MDALIKEAARFEVESVRSIDTSLEEIFLGYYGDGAALGAGKEAGHAAA